MTDKPIDLAALKKYLADYAEFGPMPDDAGYSMIEAFANASNAYLASQSATETNYVLVPREPTTEMLEAATQQCDGYNRDYYSAFYKAMIEAAALTAPQGTQKYKDDFTYVVLHGFRGSYVEWLETFYSNSMNLSKVEGVEQ